MYRAYDSLFLEQFALLRSTNDDAEKLRINTRIQDSVYNILKTHDEPTDLLDSVTTIGVIHSKKNHLKIYTWNIPLMDGDNIYNGFIHFYSTEHKKAYLYALNDHSEEINENEELLVLSDKNWFGALYYKIIENKTDYGVVYTLLGYDPNDFFTTKKIVEILSFRGDSIPEFGKPIIQYNQHRKSRLIFEYSTKASMSLLYDENLKMIVFDHLSPSKPTLVGKYQFYGPDFSYDGLKFEDGMWVYYPNIDARN